MNLVTLRGYSSLSKYLAVGPREPSRGAHSIVVCQLTLPSRLAGSSPSSSRFPAACTCSCTHCGPPGSRSRRCARASQASAVQPQGSCPAADTCVLRIPLTDCQQSGSKGPPELCHCCSQRRAACRHPAGCARCRTLRWTVCKAGKIGRARGK